MERVSTDDAFRSRMKDDWQDAIGELDLSASELAAISTQDEDALRRLAGVDVAGFVQNSFWGTDLICSWLCFTTIDTPTSGRHCGTGPGGCPGTGTGTGTGTGGGTGGGTGTGGGGLYRA